MRGPSYVVLAFGVLALASARPAFAQATPWISCPPGDLLRGMTAIRSVHVEGDLTKIDDGAVAPEGAGWNSSPAVVLRTPAASIDYDLGAPVALTAIFVQADANDSYVISGSLDGESWERLFTVDSVVDSRGHGLRTRSADIAIHQVRYIRIGEPRGDGRYSISEVEVFCRRPPTFPPSLKIEEGAPQPEAVERVWNDATSSRWELVLAIMVMGLIVYDRWLRRRRGRGVIAPAWAALALFAIATYFNMGAFHFSTYIHAWDTFHYFVGAKYFPELRYVHLYDCVAVAETEDGLEAWVRQRKMTDLRTNRMVPAASALADVERCKARFSPERWDAFKADVAYFRDRETPERWQEIQIDHGFNGTPVWLALGSVLANLAPAGDRSLLLLTSIDPAYLLAAAWLLVRAFGWRTAALALAVFATGAPQRFLWTGGAFLRWDWLFYSVAAIAALKLEWPFVAGLSLGYAASLRIFPGLAIVGPLLACVYFPLARKPVDTRYLRLFAGTIVASIVLGAISLPVVGGLEGYREFVENSKKHARTILNNNIGLPTVLAYDSSETSAALYESESPDPWFRWRSAKLDAFAARRPVYWLAIAAYLGAMFVAVRGKPPWVTAALGLTFVPLAVDLTCYYYALVLPVAVLAEGRDRIAFALLGCMAVTQVIDWAPFSFMPQAVDEKYHAMSIAILVTFAAIVASHFSRRSATALLKPG